MFKDYPSLLPCPFCGGEVHFVTRDHCKECRDIQCKTEGCFMEFGVDGWMDPGDMSEQWNKRAQPIN